MYTSNLAEKIENDTFYEWDNIARETAKVFELNKKKTEQLYNNNTAKIIAKLPFAAGCK